MFKTRHNGHRLSLTIFQYLSNIQEQNITHCELLNHFPFIILLFIILLLLFPILNNFTQTVWEI